MELRHLRYFVAVANTMSFRQAAKQLEMTQPPLSQQIQQLEKELGFSLFHRHGRTISLTNAGEHFLAEASHILTLVNGAVRRGQQVARGERGQLRLGFVESAAFQLLPLILKRFQQQLPHVKISLISMTSNEQLQALDERQIDVGFCRLAQEDMKATMRQQVQTIAWEPLCVVVPRNHRLAQAKTLTATDLAPEKMILFPQRLGIALFARIAKVFQQAGLPLNIAQEAIQMTTIAGLVAAELGISVLPMSVVNVSRPDVVYIPLSPLAQVPMSLVWQDQQPSPVLHHFLDTARAVAKSSDTPSY